MPPPDRPLWYRPHMLAILALWLAIYGAALFTPPLLDDADATHAQAARAMLATGDYTTLHVNGIRYLEKAPLPYWLVAASYRVFGANAFATHLPSALAVLALALLGYLWSRRAFAGEANRTALYTAFATLTCTGVFLFTRIFIPEVLLSLFLATALYAFLRTLHDGPPVLATNRYPEPSGSGPVAAEDRGASAPSDALLTPARLYPYLLWTSLALAVLTKGLIALVFFFATAALYLSLTSTWHQYKKLKPASGLLLFLLIAAPWHILASLRNTGGAEGHGFFWFYFINEHVLRFLGRRVPHDYNKLPAYLYWSLHLIWLFPWSLFSLMTASTGWRAWRLRRNAYRHAVKVGKEADGPGPPYGWTFAIRWPLYRFTRAVRYATNTFASCTVLLLSLFTALVLLFFSLSTNQEYYTFPVYLPLLMLICAAIARAEHENTKLKALLAAHITYAAIGLTAAAALAYGLWSARGLPFTPDIGDLLAHRAVGDYTLSMSHFFDLTGPSFAALRLPAALALITFAIGPTLAVLFRLRRRHFAATATLALTSALFLIAAHLALGRFAPMLSSKDFADKIEELADDRQIDRNNNILLFGDQAFGSSIPFYLNEEVELVDGRSTSMLFGSTFPDAPPIFITSAQLAATWGHGRRKILFIPAESRDQVNALLGPRQIILEETSGKALITDRPLNPLQ